MSGQAGSRSALARSRHRKHAVTPGRTSGPTMPIASSAETARCGTRDRRSSSAVPGGWGPASTTRSGGFTGCRPAGAPAAAGRAWVMTPEPIRSRVMESATAPEPRTWTQVAARRANNRAPPSPSWADSEAAAKAGMSCGRKPRGIDLTVSAGKSMSTPAAASTVRTRSVTAAGMPRLLASATSWFRSRLPSSSLTTSAALRMPISATARRGSTPIWTVSRSRQIGNSPNLSAGLTAVRLPPGADNSPRLSRSKPGFRAESLPFPRNGRRPGPTDPSSRS